MRFSTERHYGPPLTAEHYCQYRKQITEKGAWCGVVGDDYEHVAQWNWDRDD